MVQLVTITPALLASMYANMNTLFNKGMGLSKIFWDRVATLAPSSTGTEDYPWLGAFPRMVEWFNERTIQNIKLHGYSIKNRDFECTIEVDRDDVLDNKLGLYQMALVQMGQSAREHPDELVFSLLPLGFSTACYDGQYFFSATHPVGAGVVSNYGAGTGTAWYLLATRNFIKPMIYQHRQDMQFVAMDSPTDENLFTRKKYRYGVDYRSSVGWGLWQMAFGSKAPLDADGYAAARAAIASMKNDKGAPLGFSGDLLVVPPLLEGVGREVLLMQRSYSGSDNVWYNTAELLCVPWLS